MSVDLALELAQLVVGLLGAIFKKNPTQIEQNIIDIIKKGYQAYEDQTGKPIDPSLINPIEPID